MSHAAKSNDEYEEECLLIRLGIHRTIYVVRPSGQAAALRLRDRGAVTVETGQGRDEGLLIVRAAARPPRPQPLGAA
jgi:hypothetical protein